MSFAIRFSLFPIRPGHQIAEAGPTIMPPGQRWVLHLTEGTDARRAPARKRDGQPPGFLSGSGQSNGGSPAAHRLRGLERFSQISDRLDINKSVQARELKAE